MKNAYRCSGRPLVGRHVALSENDGVGVQLGVALSVNASCTSNPPGWPLDTVTWLSWLERSTYCTTLSAPMGGSGAGAGPAGGPQPATPSATASECLSIVCLQCWNGWSEHRPRAASSARQKRVKPASRHEHCAPE